MESLSQQAYEHLRSLITTSQLKYQNIYSETRLAKELGISRTPFRDAIHRLAQEGYIDIIPSRGFCLHQLTRKDVIETFQTRSALEAYSTAEIAKQHSSPKARCLFQQLHKLMDQMTEIEESTKSIPDFFRYDLEFHTAIIRYLNNQQFIDLFDRFLYRMQRLASLSLSHPGRMEDTCREHMAILHAMEAGDTRNIYEITLQHMEIPRQINLEDIAF